MYLNDESFQSLFTKYRTRILHHRPATAIGASSGFPQPPPSPVGRLLAKQGTISLYHVTVIQCYELIHQINQEIATISTILLLRIGPITKHNHSIVSQFFLITFFFS